MRLPSDDFKRYVGLRYTVTGTNPTQGALHAYLTPAPQRNINYASAVTIGRLTGMADWASAGRHICGVECAECR